MKTLMIFGVINLIALLACKTDDITVESGSLDLKVNIGPLCPVEPCTKTAAELKQVYEAYSFTLSNVKDKSIALQQNLSYDGTKGVLKSTNIAVGDYELNIKPENIFTKRGFPKTVTIEKNKVTTLEIDIDTGLR